MFQRLTAKELLNEVHGWCIVMPRFKQILSQYFRDLFYYYYIFYSKYLPSEVLFTWICTYLYSIIWDVPGHVITLSLLIQD